jgi:hypothetical protein
MPSSGSGPRGPSCATCWHRRLRPASVATLPAAAAICENVQRCVPGRSAGFPTPVTPAWVAGASVKPAKPLWSASSVSKSCAAASKRRSCPRVSFTKGTGFGPGLGFRNDLPWPPSPGPPLADSAADKAVPKALHAFSLASPVKVKAASRLAQGSREAQGRSPSQPLLQPKALAPEEERTAPNQHLLLQASPKLEGVRLQPSHSGQDTDAWALC